MSTRTSTQARSHAQKFFVKLEKRAMTLDQFLDTLDLDNLGKSLIFSDLEDEEESPARFVRAEELKEQEPPLVAKSEEAYIVPEPPASPKKEKSLDKDLNMVVNGLCSSTNSPDSSKAQSRTSEDGPGGIGGGGSTTVTVTQSPKPALKERQLPKSRIGKRTLPSKRFLEDEGLGGVIKLRKTETEVEEKKEERQ